MKINPKSKIARTVDFIDKNFYNIVLYFILLLNIFPFLAPVFAKLGWHIPAQLIYFVYSFFCHQLDWRSIHAFDYQYAWCARDTFIWLNILLMALATKRWNIKPLKWYWLIIFIIPIALDGGVQTIATLFGFYNSEPIYMSTNLMRMLTGTFFGIGFGLWIMPNMMESTTSVKERKPFKYNLIFIVFVLMLMNFILYIALTFIWDITSTVNKPKNMLDFAVKTPANAEEWLIRSKDTI
jgi:uncharacterized membrane protein